MRKRTGTNPTQPTGNINEMNVTTYHIRLGDFTISKNNDTHVYRNISERDFRISSGVRDGSYMLSIGERTTKLGAVGDKDLSDLVSALESGIEVDGSFKS